MGNSAWRQQFVLDLVRAAVDQTALHVAPSSRHRISRHIEDVSGSVQPISELVPVVSHQWCQFTRGIWLSVS